MPDPLTTRSLARFNVHDTTLLFMHIPKTAGTSIRSLLEEFYDEDRRIYLYDEPPGMSLTEYRDLPEDRKRGTKLVYGHFHFGVHQWLPQRSRYLTVFRDPVDRVVSLYFHYERVPGSNRHETIVEEKLSLEDFIFGGITLQTDNEMVRQIAGTHGVEFGTCSEEHLEIAWRHLYEHFAGVLFMEQMQQGVENLRTLLGLPPKELGRENVNTARAGKSLDADLLHRIGEFNRLDRELYRRARERWGRAWLPS